MKDQAQTVLHVSLRALDMLGAELLREERGPGRAFGQARRHVEKVPREQFDCVSGGACVAGQHHRAQVNARQRARDRLDHFHRFLPASVAAVARVEVLFAIDHAVCHRHAFAGGRGSFRPRGCSDVKPARDALVHGPHLGAHCDQRVAVVGHRHEIREHQVAHEVAALDQQARGDPCPPLGPAGNGRRMQQVLPQRAGGLVEVR